ncbi:MAG: bifunctional phosphopantothenoylcysteine decarboxylase/phosphopantothenate--cysteine ligase CoaBC [Micrococcaceae bacterium]
MRIVLGVSGGIAAYKAALLLRLMTEAGHDVEVVPTQNALRFVGAPTWEALSGRPVHVDTFEAVDKVNHVALGRRADLVVIAPATADFLARAAAGLAPDLLGNVLLTATSPIVIAPAMHTEMWQNAATRANVETLRSRGLHVLDPDSGRLTGQDTGPGRLPEPERIWEFAQHAAALPHSPSAMAPSPLRGRRVVVTAGGTREALDPVRYLGNRSSGKQGTELARAAHRAGAEVTLIAAAMDVPAPEQVTTRRVESTRELLNAVLEESTGADVLVMAAAVADFRPVSLAASKMKKSDDGSSPTIELERTEDILATAVQQRDTGANLPDLIVGFAAETGDEHGSVLDYAQAKLERKGCEMLVVNQVGRDKVFGQDDTEITVLYRDGSTPVSAHGTKADVSTEIVDLIGRELNADTV